MATFTLHLEKDDITTRQIGNHFEIATPEVTINFTREALKEFIKDATLLLTQQETNIEK